MAQGAGGAAARGRPLSPHLSVWRWHVTMFNSIMMRASGAALYAAAFGLSAWLVAAMLGPQAYGPVEAALVSPLGQALIYLAAAALIYHFFNGLRHLMWDTGHGLRPGAASFTALLALVLTILCTGGLYALANLKALAP